MTHATHSTDRRSSDPDLILSHAARLFREQGFEKTSLRQVAKACGILPGSLHYRYSTKEALLIGLMRRGIEVVTAEVQSALGSSPDPGEQLRQCINAHLRALVTDSDTVYVLIFEWRALSPGGRQEIIALRDRYESFWTEIIQCMVDQGVIRKDIDPKLLRLVGIGALNWVATWFDPRGEHSLEAIGDVVWRIIMSGVLNDPLRG
jgi:TetR/AcrR family transcriptional regulator, cholesterol catabolism regulator